MSLPGVAVIVLSYNRPYWLAAALRSVVGAQQIIVADDGSDFDVRQVAELDAGVAVQVERNPSVPVSRRLSEPRPPRLFNRALRRVRQQIVTYLCDDDLFSPYWIPTLREWFARHPEGHMVRGDWNTLGTDQSCFGPWNSWVLTTGNFAYRTTCALLEGCWWDEHTIGSHDAFMLTRFMRLHGWPDGGQAVPSVPVLAGWRREHRFNMLHYTDPLGSTAYTPAAAAVLASGWLEERL